MANLCYTELIFLHLLNWVIIFNQIWAGALNSLRYFNFEESQSWKNYAWYCRAMTNHNLRANRASDKKLKKTDLHFLKKWWGSVFFNFMIRVLLRPQITIRRRANISHVIFSWFWPLKIEKSEKKLYGHNPLRILNHIGY